MPLAKHMGVGRHELKPDQLWTLVNNMLMSVNYTLMVRDVSGRVQGREQMYVGTPGMLCSKSSLLFKLTASLRNSTFKQM